MGVANDTSIHLILMSVTVSLEELSIYPTLLGIGALECLALSSENYVTDAE